MPVAHDLRTWYLEEGMNVEMTDVSTHHSSIAQPVPWKTLAQITDHEVHMTLPSNGDVSRVKAVCTHVRHDPVYKVNETCEVARLPINRATLVCPGLHPFELQEETAGQQRWYLLLLEMRNELRRFSIALHGQCK